MCDRVESVTDYFIGALGVGWVWVGMDMDMGRTSGGIVVYFFFSEENLLVACI